VEMSYPPCVSNMYNIYKAVLTNNEVGIPFAEDLAQNVSVNIRDCMDCVKDATEWSKGLHSRSMSLGNVAVLRTVANLGIYYHRRTLNVKFAS